MDRLSSVMLRLSLLWLVAGVVVGGAMMVDRSIPGAWRLWLQPTHGHILFVGWFLQFAIGVAYWLLPRKRSPARPLGYDLRLAQIAVVCLNGGLVLRVIGEPLDRTGHSSIGLLALSAALPIVAVILFAGQLWPRMAPKVRGAG